MNVQQQIQDREQFKRLFFSSDERQEGDTTDNLTIYLDEPLRHSRYMSILSVEIPNTAYMFKQSASVFYVQTTGAGLIANTLPTNIQFEPATRTTTLRNIEATKSFSAAAPCCAVTPSHSLMPPKLKWIAIVDASK